MQRLHQMTNEGLARMGESLLLRRRGWWRCMMAVLVCIGVLCSSVMSPVEAEAVPNDTLVSKLGGTVSTVSPRGTTIDCSTIPTVALRTSIRTMCSGSVTATVGGIPIM